MAHGETPMQPKGCAQRSPADRVRTCIKRGWSFLANHSQCNNDAVFRC